ncbi:MAG: FHA domain-containing protein [Verrucomicrobiota bacterium]
MEHPTIPSDVTCRRAAGPSAAWRNAIRRLSCQVSSRHAALEQRPDGQLFLVDLNSRNGTYLNSPSQRLTEATPITPDDVAYFSRQFKITIGEVIRAVGARAARKDGRGQDGAG